ncbi:hypothetical protein JV173_03330 [Acholeplasma equirhinis]|uniref:hypothetical protein n=1 Tax=Acholeplasma equirhinis TaxID=555393 RepID=UPI00197A973A|nr:hypothetical protein [Acholeplasma equirhinis]MBN3490541.1 hypothetical protein [Acholeplasma equirhinis]
MQLESVLIVYTIAFVLLLPILFVKGFRKKLRKKLDYSIYYIKYVLGWIIGINGDIRMGKTSLMSGLSSLCQLIIINDIDDLLNKTMKIFKYIDFNVLNDQLKNYYETVIDEKIGYPDFEKITEMVLEIYQLDGDSIHYDMIGHKKIRKLILDYIFSYYCLEIRNNFVQSKTPFYSNITHQFNLKLNLEWLNIRDAFKEKDYAILDWMVILIDELTDEAGAMKYLEDPKDESGAKEYRRKLGQIHQERNRIISTKQDVMDEIKKFRNLTHSNLVIDERVSTLGNHMWIYHLIEFVCNIPILLLKLFVINPIFIWSKLTRKGLSWGDIYKYYHDKTGIIRKQESKLYYYKMFFQSIGYNRYQGYKLKRAEDIERVTADRDYFDLVIPTKYCWGTYNTHYYASMQEDLLNNSTTQTSEVNPFKKINFFIKDKVTEQEQNGVGEFEFN